MHDTVDWKLLVRKECWFYSRGIAQKCMIKGADAVLGEMFMGAVRTMLMLMWAVSDVRGNRSRGTLKQKREKLMAVFLKTTTSDMHDLLNSRVHRSLSRE